MGSPADGGASDADVQEESQRFGDIVLLGGADADPPAPTGADAHLRVTAEAAPRAFRAARALEWLLLHRPDFEYVAHLPDDAFVNLPGLLRQVSLHANSSLAMGFLAAPTPLTVASSEAGESCETCRPHPEHEKFCLRRISTAPGGIDFRGCLALAQQCCPEDDEASPGCFYLEACVQAKQQPGWVANLYYGVAVSPKWLRGPTWVLGRNPAEFIGDNALDLKVKGTPDMVMGFWLAALEDVHFVDFPPGALRHPPAAPSGEDDCSGGEIFASGMDEQRWDALFDAERCELRCR